VLPGQIPADSLLGESARVAASLGGEFRKLMLLLRREMYFHNAQSRSKEGACQKRFHISTIFPASIRLYKWMDEPASVIGMSGHRRPISEIVAEEGARLRNFIRRRVPDPADAEDIAQEVFYELVEANHLLMPIEHVTGWLFRVARNRINGPFPQKEAGEF